MSKSPPKPNINLFLDRLSNLRGKIFLVPCDCGCCIESINLQFHPDTLEYFRIFAQNFVMENYEELRIFLAARLEVPNVEKS
jgi:hypothetical protein